MTGRCARALPVVVGVAAALSFTAPLPAAIVPQQGIAGVRLGMTQARVRSLLGRESKRVRGSNDFGRYTELRYPGIRVLFQGERSVTSVSTTRTSERTRGGVGVGSREAQLRARLPGLRCRTESGFRHCFLGRFLPGRRVTDFAIRGGRVTRVDVGFVID